LSELPCFAGFGFPPLATLTVALAVIYEHTSEVKGKMDGRLQNPLDNGITLANE